MPGLIDLHCVAQVPELVHVDTLLCLHIFPFNINSYGAFKSKLKYIFSSEPGILFLCCCSSCCVSYLLLFVLLVGELYRPGPFVQPLLSEIKSFQYRKITFFVCKMCVENQIYLC